MKLFGALHQAVSGWIMILRGDELWREQFRFTPAGLATALVLFYLFAFLAVVLASLEVGVPTLQGFGDIMVIQSLGLLALVIGIFGTRYAVRDKGPVLPLLVPGIYALVFYLALGALTALVAAFMLPLFWLALVWLLFRLGRLAGGWTIGVSAAFAVLTVVLLVGTPISLYMLISSLPPA